MSLLYCVHQPVDEVSEGLTWAIWEGCLEDVAFLFNTGVEVNRKDQVRSTFRCHHIWIVVDCNVNSTVNGYTEHCRGKPEQAMQSSTELVL